MPKIVEYQQQVLPSGGAGGQIQPYKEAPPMYPLTSPADAAKVRFLREIGDTAVDYMRLQEREQKITNNIIINKILNDFDIFSNDEQNKQKIAYPGEKSFAPGNDFLSSFAATQKEEIDRRVSESGLPEVERAVLRNLLIHNSNGQLKGLSDYAIQQRNTVSAGNLQAYLDKSIFSIVHENKDPGTFIAGFAVMAEKNGRPDLVDIGTARLQEASIQAQTKRDAEKKEARITGIYSQVLTDAKGDLEKALEIISDPKSIKKYDITMKEKNAIAESINQNLRIKNDNYKRFAEDVVGKATVKILNNTPVADIELEGLEPHDKAIVEKVRDYQDRQNRAENREKRSIERAKTTEDRQIAREKIFDAKVAKQEKSDEIEGQIRAKILNGDPIDLRADVYAKVPDGLKNDAANRLISMASKVQKDPKYKLGLVVLNKALSLGVIDSVTYGKAVIDFQDKVDAEQATGKRVIEIAEEIVNPKKANAIGEWLNNIFGNLGKTLLGKGKPEEKITQKPTSSQTDLEFTAKKHGISVDEVKRRLGIK